MPARDGTGPLGMGPMTGRGLGPCGAAYYRGFPYRYGWPAPYYGYGYGWGRGYGYGRGWGRGFGYGRGWGRGWWW